jgi:hypothetical protein
MHATRKAVAEHMPEGDAGIELLDARLPACRLGLWGTSYRKLKDDLRRDAAVNYLCTTRISVAKVAGLLLSGCQRISARIQELDRCSAVAISDYHRSSIDVIALTLAGDQAEAEATTTVDCH